MIQEPSDTQALSMLDGLTSTEYTDLITSIGTHRHERKLLPMQVTELVSRALKFNSIEKIAQELRLKDTSVIRRFLALSKLPPETQSLVSWGNKEHLLGFSTASEISRIVDESERAVLVNAALEHRFAKQEITTIVRRVQRGGVTVKTAVDEILKLKPVADSSPDSARRRPGEPRRPQDR
jgi:hypothetical protein